MKMEPDEFIQGWDFPHLLACSGTSLRLYLHLWSEWFPQESMGEMCVSGWQDYYQTETRVNPYKWAPLKVMQSAHHVRIGGWSSLNAGNNITLKIKVETTVFNSTHRVHVYICIGVQTIERKRKGRMARRPWENRIFYYFWAYIC